MSRHLAVFVLIGAVVVAATICSLRGKPTPGTAEAAKAPPTVTWEVLDSGALANHERQLLRTPVPGGWIYREVARNEMHGSIAESIAFVPTHEEHVIERE